MLAAWTASPARFREDANAEEDLVRGGYRDRLVVELAQNAADAAARAGVPGRLTLDVRDGALLATNTGAPLDADGVVALATLRASAKRDAVSVGRFGVGFAAVLAVTDEPVIRSAGGGVRWSAAQARELVAATPELAAELDRRHGVVPVLRLPFVAAAAPDVTVVELPLRDADAEELVRRLLDEVDERLLLVLPGLAEIEVGGRLLRRPDWPAARAEGRLPPELLADRPVEERERDTWSVLVARPPSGAAGVVYAPTPTDDALSLPVLLAATFPLDPSRRRIAPGPLTDFLVGRAASAYVDLLCSLDPTPATLDLVPTGFATGEIDGAVRAALLALLPDAPFLPGGLRPAAAAVLDLGPASDPVATALADTVPGLLPPGWSARSPALAVLGVRRLTEADVVDAVAGLDRPPGWWHALYDALATVADRDALGALPVPLVGGALVTGPRGVVLADAPVDLAALGLRVAHPGAAHPLLERLGAVPATPRALLADPRVHAAVESSYDMAEDESAALAAAVLDLVAAADPAPGELPWLAELTLPAADGESCPAGELLLPGGPLAAVVGADTPFGLAAPELVERYGADVLTAVGVLSTFAVLREEDASEAEHDLDGEGGWLDEALAEGGSVRELVAVRDLELVADWPAALELLSAPALRAAIGTPARVQRPDGSEVSVPSYSRWWLARHPVLGGQRPDRLRVPGTDPLLAGVYDDAPAGRDPAFLAAIGCRTSLAEVLADVDAAADLLDRIGERDVGRAQARALHAALVVALSGERPGDAAPARVRAVRDGAMVGVAPDEALLVDAPDLLPLLVGRAIVPVPVTLAGVAAALLGVPLARAQVDGAVESSPDVVRRWAAVPGVEIALARLGGGAPPATSVAEHSSLRVAGRTVAWRALPDVDHVDGSPGALGRALAWRLGRWERRAAAAEAFEAAAAARLDELLAEDDLDPSG